MVFCRELRKLETEALTDEEWKARGAIEGVVFIDAFEAEVLRDSRHFFSEKYMADDIWREDAVGVDAGIIYCLKT